MTALEQVSTRRYMTLLRKELCANMEAALEENAFEYGTVGETIYNACLRYMEEVKDKTTAFTSYRMWLRDDCYIVYGRYPHIEERWRDSATEGDTSIFKYTKRKCRSMGRRRVRALHRSIMKQTALDMIIDLPMPQHYVVLEFKVSKNDQ